MGAHASDADALNKRILAIDTQLGRIENPVELKRLKKARNDLQRILDRRDRLWSQSTSVEAAMLSMADTVTTDTERARCALDMLKCLCELRWSERRLEAREMLLKLLRQGEAGGLQSAEQTQLSALLRVSWFHAGNSCSSR